MTNATNTPPQLPASRPFAPIALPVNAGTSARRFFGEEWPPSGQEGFSAKSILHLAPGEVDMTTFSGEYFLIQNDLDARRVDNTATVRGTPPGGPPDSVTDDDTGHHVVTGLKLTMWGQALTCGGAPVSRGPGPRTWTRGTRGCPRCRPRGRCRSPSSRRRGPGRWRARSRRWRRCRTRAPRRA